METIIPIVRDVLVIGYMFVLRIGVPFIIVMMVGSALRKWLEESDAKPAARDERIAKPVPVK